MGGVGALTGRPRGQNYPFSELLWVIRPTPFGPPLLNPPHPSLPHRTCSCSSANPYYQSCRPYPPLFSLPYPPSTTCPIHLPYLIYPPPPPVQYNQQNYLSSLTISYTYSITLFALPIQPFLIPILRSPLTPQHLASIPAPLPPSHLLTIQPHLIPFLLSLLTPDTYPYPALSSPSLIVPFYPTSPYPDPTIPNHHNSCSTLPYFSPDPQVVVPFQASPLSNPFFFAPCQSPATSSLPLMHPLIHLLPPPAVILSVPHPTPPLLIHTPLQPSSHPSYSVTYSQIILLDSSIVIFIFLFSFNQLYHGPALKQHRPHPTTSPTAPQSHTSLRLYSC